MKTGQMPADDMPDLDSRDWYDDFAEALDAISAEELSTVSSFAELGLHLALYGFSREEEFTELKMWQGLFVWILSACNGECALRIELDSMYGKKLEGSAKQQELASRYRSIWAKSLVVENFIVSDTNVNDFCHMKQEDRDQVLDSLERVKNSNGRFSLVVDRFHNQILKCSVPEDDIPEE